ncbi:hypothetical protein TL16_g05636 [Triparma laevis f. inornata]|uniref:Peptidase M3A/M3B catalytic domain-containing protein n=1 Tax=Triparma laevis f. inornata TaxID=1714386 RepID=A0A9W7ALP5_9STRA|nr:hypothetical protein TL16_g05636 [Triparma laevis f. inornata]
MTSNSSSSSQSRPLLNLPGYTTPDSFLEQSNTAIKECTALRSDLLNSVNSDDKNGTSTSSSLLLNLHRLDTISNTICAVIDLTELIRNVHTSPVWRSKANESFGILYSFISELNSDQQLYDCVKKIEEKGVKHFNYEESRMISLLRSEFESDGIHLPDEKRKEIVNLKNDLMDLESEFQNNIIEGRNIYAVHSREIKALNFDGGVLEQLRGHLGRTVRDEETVLTTDNYFTSSILKYEPSPSLRRETYIQSNTVSPQNLLVLSDLRSLRHEISLTLGFPSHSDKTINDKMAGNRTNVLNFLQTQMSSTQSGYKREMEILTDKKFELEGNRIIKPWDIPYYVNICKENSTVTNMDYSEYLTVSNCLNGMKNVCGELLGVSMFEEKVEVGEGWCESLIKFNFSDKDEGNHLGTLYLDLFPREGKYNHAAHFTVRCGCSYLKGTDLKSQKPVVAVVANLGSGDGLENSISHNEAETLFHEFGHAMHSIMSRTKVRRHEERSDELGMGGLRE